MNYNQLDTEEIEALSCCYIFPGSIIPSLFGYYLLVYSTDESFVNQNEQNCNYLVKWCYVSGSIFLIHAFFYIVIALIGMLVEEEQYDQIQKYAQIAKFEDNVWRTFVLTFSLLLIFSSYGILNKQFGDQFEKCGELYSLTETYYYVFLVIFGCFAIAGLLIAFQIETVIFDEETYYNLRYISQQNQTQQQQQYYVEY